MKVVLHICCGVCAAGVVERLASEGHEVLGFFFNPSIHPPEEYQRRLEVARQVARQFEFPLAVGEYNTDDWFQAARPLESEPEGGKRCSVCFRLRLERAYHYMLEQKADAFTTTLTVSPTKSARVINQLGQEIGGNRFLVRDFKKKDGFRRATELARRWDLYRQHYCGCIYSLRTGNRRGVQDM